MKNIWSSRTIWLNVIGLLAAILQIQFGFILAPEAQISILTLLNLVFRFGTDESIGPKVEIKK